MSLNGTRLSKFMESVEQVAGAVNKTVTEPEELAVEDAAPPPEPSPESMPEPASPARSATDPWAPLLDAGLKLIESLAAAQTGAPAQSSPLLETDAKTGKSYLKLPVPEPETLQRLGTALQGLLAGLRRD